MLRQRVLTALVLIPAVLLLLFAAPPGWLAGAFVFVTLMAGWEWLRLAGVASKPLQLTLLVLLVLALLVWWRLPQLRVAYVGAALLWWGVAAIAVLVYPRAVAAWNRPQVLLASALIVLPATGGSLIAVHAHGEHGARALLTLLFIVWSADIGAYFVGRAFGRRKLAPAVSPGKSWEGAVGGLVLALPVAFGMALWAELPLVSTPLLFAVAVCAVVLVSIFGDLTESMLKRARGVKDSGALLPGHGGVLDRIDSLLSTAPLWALLIGATALPGAA